MKVVTIAPPGGFHTRDQLRAPTRDEWARAARLVNFFAQHIAHIAPGNYGELFLDLNTHFISDAQIRPNDEREKDPR